MKNLFPEHFAKRMLVMLVSVIVMGMNVGFLSLTGFGLEPCSAMNTGVAKMFGWQFGNYQAVFNTVLLLVVLLIDRSMFGFGTIGNMFLIGYTYDFTKWVLASFFGITSLTNLTTRILVLVVALAGFVISASFYMNSGLGLAPYDAMGQIIYNGLSHKGERKISYRAVRMAYDTAVSLFAFLIGGQFGVITVLMVLTLGPMIEVVSKRLKF